jgi:hypothetical protein
LNDFLARKRKNCASRFEAKKAVMGDEGLSVASRLNCTGTGYSITVQFWLFREINGDKVATAPYWFLNQLTINRAI